MTRDLRLLAASLFLWGVGEGLFFYIQPVYLAQLGANAVQVGFVLGLAGAAMTVVHIPAGMLADHFGRKAIMTAAWMFGAVATVLMFLATTLWPFVAALVLYSLTAFVMSPLSSYVTEARGPWSVGRALTGVAAAFSAGSVIGPVSGGLLAAQFGHSPSLRHRRPFVRVFVCPDVPASAISHASRIIPKAGSGLCSPTGPWRGSWSSSSSRCWP